LSTVACLKTDELFACVIDTKQGEGSTECNTLIMARHRLLWNVILATAIQLATTIQVCRKSQPQQFVFDWMKQHLHRNCQSKETKKQNKQDDACPSDQTLVQKKLTINQ
jgi:hypothetical protein